MVDGVTAGGQAAAADETTEQKPEDARVGLSNQDPAVIAKQILTWWRESADKSKERRTNRKTAHKMLDGDQWEQADRDQMKRQKRPALTFNLLLSIISAVEGQEQNNRQEMKYYGTGQDDVVAGE